MSDALIQLIEVEKSYTNGDSTIVALHPTSLSLEPHKVTLLMGPSGSGKTTLISIIGGVVYPDKGTVYYKNEPISASSPKKLADFRLNEIGFIFQHFNLIQPLSALENVMQPLLLKGYPFKKARAHALSALADVELTGRKDNLPRALSGGQQQRVAIARALVAQPSIILCDEPTASLDARSAHKVMQNLTLLSKQGKAVVIVTHDHRLKRYADTIVYVEEGKVSKEPPHESEF